MDELIRKQDALDAFTTYIYNVYKFMKGKRMPTDKCRQAAESVIGELPTVQPERLTDDDFETIRIHLNAYKEKLCNQHRWEEAEEYQRIIDRFVVFASAHQKHGEWEYHSNPTIGINPEDAYCSCCGFHVDTTGNIDFDEYNFCPHCCADMRGGKDGTD